MFLRNQVFTPVMLPITISKLYLVFHSKRGLRAADMLTHIISKYSIEKDKEHVRQALTKLPRQVLARGMGLQMAVVGRRTKFTLYLNNSTTLDLVVEIKNDEGDYCSHRITNRSPLRSRVLSKQALKVSMLQGM